MSARMMWRCAATGAALVWVVSALVLGQARSVQPGDPLPGLTPPEFEEFRLGLDDFLEVETAEEGLGPAFNGTSCAACHNVPAVGGISPVAEVRAGRQMPDGSFAALDPGGESLFHLFSIPGHACQPTIPRDANVIVRRVPLPLFGAGLACAQSPKPVRIGVATSGGTTLPALVISQRKLDEKHGLKIEWVRLDQAALQKAFALRQFDVSFAEVASDLIRQRARGDKVKSVYAGIMANVYLLVKKDAPYKTIADLKGKKLGLYSLTSSSTAAIVRMVREKWKLELRKDFELVVAPPPVLAGLLQKGDIEGMINVDPLVLRLLESGNYRQILDADGEWQAQKGARLLVTTLAAWDDYAQKNPDEIRRLIRAYKEAVEIIGKDPQVYVSTGFIKDTPETVKLFHERFSKLYTGQWNQALIDSNRAVFDTAIEMGNLESVPADWYTFEYAN